MPPNGANHGEGTNKFMPPNGANHGEGTNTTPILHEYRNIITGRGQPPDCI